MSDTPLAPPVDLAVEEFDRAMAEEFGGAPNLVPDLAPAPPLDASAEGDDGGDPGETIEDLPPMAAEDLDTLRACAAEPANDIGNARRLRLRFGRDLISVQRIGYHVWSDTNWREDIEGAATRPIAHRVVGWISAEAAVMDPLPAEAEAMAAAEPARERAAELRKIKERTDGQEAELAACDMIDREGASAYKRWQSRRSTRRKFATTAGNSGRIEGMLREAAPYLSRPVGALDAHPLDLNVQNGTIRFAAVDVAELGDADPDAPANGTIGMAGIRPHDRRDLISKLAPVWWCPGSAAPTFAHFLETILPDAGIRGFVQRYFGYATTALTGEQVFAIFHGEGSNGKSTLVDIVSQVMGDYATTLPIATLVGDEKRKGGEATPDLVRLPGARLVSTAEPKEGLALDESLIKNLTGGERILVRRLNQEFVEIYPLFKLVISCNRKPVIKGDDDGIWRRVMLVPFEVQIPKEKRDKKLKDKLWAERAGILDWLVEGARAYLSMGLCPPDAVMAATQEYRAESDPLGAFAHQALDITHSNSDTVETGSLYKAYEVWCDRAGETPFRISTFSKRMPRVAERMGFVKIKSSVSAYQGIRIRHGFEPPSSPRPHGYD